MTSEPHPNDDVIYNRLADSRAREEKLSQDLRESQDTIADLEYRITLLYAGYIVVAFVAILAWQVAK